MKIELHLDYRGFNLNTGWQGFDIYHIGFITISCQIK